MKKRASRPPDQLRQRFPVVVDLVRHLRLSRVQVYGLLQPDRYPVPATLFDVRSDLAERVAELIGQTPDYVRDFYRKAVAA